MNRKWTLWGAWRIIWSHNPVESNDLEKREGDIGRELLAS